jgi:LuxR family quorum-sensing system transcriptional regulator CciR
MNAQPSRDTFAKVRDFASAVRQVESLSSLRGLLGDVVPTFGVDYFLMAHHVDFGRPVPGAVQMGNYPREFVAKQREVGGWRHDPVLLACERTTTGFFWSQLGELIPLQPKHMQRVDEVRRAGLGEGFAVPNHIPGEYSGSVQFAVGHGRSFPREMASALQSLATYAFEAARRLARSSNEPIVLSAPLTERQLDCLLLAARGKSDTDIGQLLGLSPRTVNAYMEEAKRRYCVATRQQLMILALFNRQITFSEVLQ